MVDFEPRGPAAFFPIQQISGGRIVDIYEAHGITGEMVFDFLTLERPRDLATHPFAKAPCFFTPYDPNSLIAPPIQKASEVLSLQGDTMPTVQDLMAMQSAMLECVSLLGGKPLENGFVTLAPIPHDLMAKLIEGVAALAACDMPELAPQRPLIERIAAIRGDAVSPCVEIAIDGANAPGYTSFLERCADQSQGWSASKITDDGGTVCFFKFDGGISGFFPDTESGKADALAFAADALITLHMRDVRTVSSHCGREARFSETGAALAWWALIDHMRTGDLGVCPICGRPFVSHARGQARVYCTNRCSQRASRMRRKSQTPPVGGLDKDGNAGSRKEDRGNER